MTLQEFQQEMYNKFDQISHELNIESQKDIFQNGRDFDVIGHWLKMVKSFY